MKMAMRRGVDEELDMLSLFHKRAYKEPTSGVCMCVCVCVCVAVCIFCYGIHRVRDSVCMC